MQEPQQSDVQKSEFLIEKIKERPVNRKKLLRRTILTASMAVIFGLIACVTFLVLEPLLSNWLYPEEKPQVIVFPEDQQEMSPEEMLADNMEQQHQMQEQLGSYEAAGTKLTREEVIQLLDGVSFDLDNYKQMHNALSVYIGELSRCMVAVRGISSTLDWFNNVQEKEHQSSGVIIAENGVDLLILADYAPLKDVNSLYLTFCDGTEIEAKVKAKDNKSELAVLEVPLSSLAEGFLENYLKIAPLGSSNPNNIVGIPVMALGRPMGTANSFGVGMITSCSETSPKADSNFRLLQTNIFGSQSAGGVLFNMNGQVIGIITKSQSPSDMRNLITAYGITDLKKRVEKMANGEQIAYLGISGRSVTAQIQEETGVPKGAYIVDIDMNSPAMEAGMQLGDVLVGIDGEEVTSYDHYITKLMTKKPGNTVKITVMRQSQGSYRSMEFEITLEEAE